jgi:hypothetical protein
MFILTKVFEITTIRDYRDGRDRVFERLFLYPFKE